MLLLDRGARIVSLAPVSFGKWESGWLCVACKRLKVTLDNNDKRALSSTLPTYEWLSYQLLTYVICLRWLWRVTGNQSSIPERQPEKRLPRLRTAAGTQITQSQHLGEVVTKHTDAGISSECPQSEWLFPKYPNENLLKGKSGASSRGNSSFSGVH